MKWSPSNKLLMEPHYFGKACFIRSCDPFPSLKGCCMLLNTWKDLPENVSQKQSVNNTETASYWGQTAWFFVCYDEHYAKLVDHWTIIFCCDFVNNNDRPTWLYLAWQYHQFDVPVGNPYQRARSQWRISFLSSAASYSRNWFIDSWLLDAFNLYKNRGVWFWMKNCTLSFKWSRPVMFRSSIIILQILVFRDTRLGI